MVGTGAIAAAPVPAVSQGVPRQGWGGTAVTGCHQLLLFPQGLEFRALACHRYFQVGLLASWDSVGSPPRPSEEPWVPWALEAAWAAHKGSTVGGSGSNRPPVIDDLMNFGATAWSRM